jgi:hypothetical protein
MSKRKVIFIALFFLVTATSCVQVKEYQKAYLNDEDMNLSQRKIESIESSFQSYREGASGAESGKIGGGCGCN